MIFDRTKQDVDGAIEIIENKVKKFLPLSTAEIETLERGTMTLNTIDRIEAKQGKLTVDMNSMGYFNTPKIENRKWTADSIFNAEDLNRMFSNTRMLREAFFTYPTTPNNPSARYHYESLNALEKILHDLETMTYEVAENYRHCGEIECGEE